eukprot:Rhum_TRINITY_DN14479_c19_g1::Rhum_TRINITY_DN14479_c19_g1_i1::g.91986::m.91986
MPVDALAARRQLRLLRLRSHRRPERSRHLLLRSRRRVEDAGEVVSGRDARPDRLRAAAEEAAHRARLVRRRRLPVQLPVAGLEAQLQRRVRRHAPRLDLLLAEVVEVQHAQLDALHAVVPQLHLRRRHVREQPVVQLERQPSQRRRRRRARGRAAGVALAVSRDLLVDLAEHLVPRAAVREGVLEVEAEGTAFVRDQLVLVEPPVARAAPGHGRAVQHRAAAAGQPGVARGGAHVERDHQQSFVDLLQALRVVRVQPRQARPRGGPHVAVAARQRSDGGCLLRLCVDGAEGRAELLVRQRLSCSVERVDAVEGAAALHDDVRGRRPVVLQHVAAFLRHARRAEEQRRLRRVAAVRRQRARPRAAQPHHRRVHDLRGVGHGVGVGGVGVVEDVEGVDVHGVGAARLEVAGIPRLLEVEVGVAAGLRTRGLAAQQRLVQGLADAGLEVGGRALQRLEVGCVRNGLDGQEVALERVAEGRDGEAGETEVVDGAQLLEVAGERHFYVRLVCGGVVVVFLFFFSLCLPYVQVNNFFPQ